MDSQARSSWANGSFSESRISAAILAYSTILCVILWLVEDLPKKSFWGLAFIAFFGLTIWLHSDNFIHKVYGHGIWPLRGF